MNAFKLASEVHGPAAVGHRHLPPPAAALHVASLRSHPSKVPPTARRLQIAVRIEEPPEELRVIKIIHADSI